MHGFVVRLCGSIVVGIAFFPKKKKNHFFFACSRNDWGRYTLEPVVEETPSLGEYFFSPNKKAIIKGSPRKRKMEQIGDTPLKQIMVWDALKLDDLEFDGEFVDSMGNFGHARKWSIDNLKNIISQIQDQIKFQE